MQRYDLLTGAAAFWARAERDIAAARRRVLVQAMTFEGDAAGLPVAAALAGAAAPDRRLLVDDYSRHVTSQTLLALPFRSAAVRDEARATRAMFDRLVAAGVGLRITNPVGRNPLRFPLRNHKKALVVDDVAYLGGINFSDHNFAWDDLMVRIADPAAADFLAADFARDWAGRPAAAAGRFGPATLLTLDGDSNEAALGPLLALFAGARKSIELVGAYPTLPFVQAAARAAQRGAAVTIHTPGPTNKPIVRDYLAATAPGARIALRLLPRMTHTKAALIDGERLVVGSVNFNFASYRTNGDLLAIIDDPALVAAFEARVLVPARAAGRPIARSDTPAWRRWRARLALPLADAALPRLRHQRPRIAVWPL
ncbi:MAG: phospholipase D-like domain-containing protein [Novosphingobium sp.]